MKALRFWGKQGAFSFGIANRVNENEQEPGCEHEERQSKQIRLPYSGELSPAAATLSQRCALAARVVQRALCIVGPPRMNMRLDASSISHDVHSCRRDDRDRKN